MSYDIQIYLVSRPDAQAGIAGAGWQIAVAGPVQLEPEDVPDQARGALPGIQYRLDLHLGGVAPAAAYSQLRKLATRIARQFRGVVVDQQKETLETPRGVRRLDVDKSSVEREDDGTLELSWFFLDSESFQRGGLVAMIDLMEATLREALPRRYGLFEPPQHRLDQEGLPHFKSFIAQHLAEGVVWYCTKPCQHVFVSIPERVGADHRGFRCARISLTLSGQALRDEAWVTELGRFWSSLAEILQPFYAEIRSDQCSASSWWWNGIPTEPALATLLGPPYVALWPGFASVASHTASQLAFINTLTRQGASIPAPPEEIAQPPDRRVERDPNTGEILSVFVFADRKYPPTWPFEGPRAGAR